MPSLIAMLTIGFRSHWNSWSARPTKNVFDDFCVADSSVSLRL